MRALPLSRLFVLVALVGTVVMTFGIVEAPNYTDAYYHFNAANRLASGQGLTDAYVWTYIGAVDHLPMPSHLYWMPLTSVLAGVGMALLNAPGNYHAAQLLLAVLCWFTALIGYAIGQRIGGTARHAWGAGLLTLFSPFFVRYWGVTDTFAAYAFFGSACLYLTGLAVTKPTLLKWIGVGATSALAHLTRADGLLLLLVACFFALLPLLRRGDGSERKADPNPIICAIVTLGAYVVVMLPYFVRNLSAVGMPLPVGGTQSIWFREYNDLFNYPPSASPALLFGDGVEQFLSSRMDALVLNLATVVTVEGVVILSPLIAIAGWTLRKSRFLHPFWLYALGMHLAMTFAFPFPGSRGGLLHSSAALLPFWGALAFVGLDEVVSWVAKRRRRWRVIQAKRVFSAAVVFLILALAILYGNRGRVMAGATPRLYAALAEKLPPGSRVLFDDPPELYYFTGFGGATLPNGSPEALLAVAHQYNIEYVVLKNDLAAIPTGLLSIIDHPPDFLEPIDFDSSLARLYAIRDQ